jgi:carboxymethylenebutenolidase
LPSVVVLQEAWGVDAHIEDVTRRFAAAGYVALAPDLFAGDDGARPAWFSAPRMAALKDFVNTMPPSAWADPKARDLALAKLAEPARSEIGESLTKLQATMGDVEAFVPATVDAASYLRGEHPLSRGAKVGAVGYCLGGGLAARLACADPELGAAVIYYGLAPPEERLASITCPVLGLYGANDERIIAGLPALEASMSKLGKRFEKHVYPGAPHAFFNDTRPSYHAGASRDAFARTLELFRQAL